MYLQFYDSFCRFIDRFSGTVPGTRVFREDTMQSFLNTVRSFLNGHRLLVIRLAVIAVSVLLIAVSLAMFTPLNFWLSLLIALIIIGLLWLVPQLRNHLQSRRAQKAQKAQSIQRAQQQQAAAVQATPAKHYANGDTIVMPLQKPAAAAAGTASSAAKPLGRRAQRKLDEAARDQAYQESLLTTVEPSSFTIHHSKWHPDELKTTTYDDPHHWVVFWLLFKDPFWGRDNNPADQSTRAEDYEGPLDKLIILLLRCFPLVSKWLTVLFVFVGLPMAWLTAWHHSWVVDSLRFLQRHGRSSHVLTYLLMHGRVWVLADLVFCLCVVGWGFYVGRLWQRDRLVKTSRSIATFQDQMPWRPYSQTIVPIDMFREYTPIKTNLGKLLGYCHIVITNPGKDDPVLVWMYARHPEKLIAVLNAQRIHNQPKGNESDEDGDLGAGEAPKRHTSPAHEVWMTNRRGILPRR